MPMVRIPFDITIGLLFSIRLEPRLQAMRTGISLMIGVLAAASGLLAQAKGGHVGGGHAGGGHAGGGHSGGGHTGAKHAGAGPSRTGVKAEPAIPAGGPIYQPGVVGGYRPHMRYRPNLSDNRGAKTEGTSEPAPVSSPVASEKTQAPVIEKSQPVGAAKGATNPGKTMTVYGLPGGPKEVPIE